MSDDYTPWPLGGPNRKLNPLVELVRKRRERTRKQFLAQLFFTTVPASELTTGKGVAYWKNPYGKESTNG